MTRISMTLADASMTLSLAEQSSKRIEINDETRSNVNNIPVMYVLRRGYLPTT